MVRGLDKEGSLGGENEVWRNGWQWGWSLVGSGESWKVV